MKILAFLLLAVATASADLIIEQQLESPVSNGKMTIKFKGDHGRIDMPSPAGGDMSVIINSATGETISCMHAQKIAMKMNLSEVKKAGEAAMKASGADPSKLHPSPTGQKQHIGQWDAEEYLVNAAGTEMHMWVAKDFPNWQAISAQMSKMGKLTGGAGNSPDPSAFQLPGMVVKTQVTSAVGNMTSTLLSAKEQPVADSEFLVPAGYQEMALPTGLGTPPASK